MPRRFQLQTLLEHARHRLEAAERLLRHRRRKEDAARQRWAELGGYREEYRSRLGGGSQAGIDIHMLKDFHLFLAKLDAAIKAQGEEVRRATEAWQAAQHMWSEARAKVKAYETLAERHLKSEARRAEKAEQGHMDELVNRRYATERQKEHSG